MSCILLGCTETNDALDTVLPVHADDSEMNAAKIKARNTIEEFFVARHEQGQDFQGLVKVMFEDKYSGDAEHMWVLVLSCENSRFSGVLTSPPARLTNMSQGDEVEFSLEQISDWMYPRDGKAIGAYTVRVLRNRLSPAQREQHDRGFPFSFD